MALFLGQNQAIMAGQFQGRESTWRPFQVPYKKKNGTNIYLQETIIRTRRDITKQQIRIRKLIKYYKCPDLGKQCKWVPRKTKLSIEARSPHSKVECTNCQVRENAAEEIWLLVKNQIIVGLV